MQNSFDYNGTNILWLINDTLEPLDIFSEITLHFDVVQLFAQPI